MEPLLTYLGVTLYLTARYAVVAGVVYWIYWKKNPAWAIRHRLQPMEFKRADISREMFSSLRSCLAAAVFTTLFQSPLLRARTLVYMDPFQKGVLWFFLSYLLLFVFHDTYFYWTHRWLHTKSLFRLTHHFHHLSRNPSPYAAFAFGTLESFIAFAWVAPLLYLVPLNFWLLHVFSLVSLTTDLIGHSGVDTFPVAWRNHPVFGWMNTPYLHGLHHQKVDGNFGLYSTFWDRMMGTSLKA